MNYSYRLILIVSDADRDAANQIAVEVGKGEPDRNTYSVPLSASGHEPATHWACSTIASDTMVAEMQASLPRVASVQFFRMTADDSVLRVTNNAFAYPKRGASFSIEDALAACGLQRVAPPMEGR